MRLIRASGNVLDRHFDIEEPLAQSVGRGELGEAMRAAVDEAASSREIPWCPPGEVLKRDTNSLIGFMLPVSTRTVESAIKTISGLPMPLS